ncbi:MAG: DUF4352 domain-containing protein [Gaiellales bacterium]|nr:MAG: DUF4352 domain-containing protein [Gaiellales bacterium]
MKWNLTARPGIMLAAALVVAAALWSGCGGEEEPSGGDAQLGELETRHVIEVSGVEFPLEGGDGMPSPDSGMQFALIDVAIINESSRELVVSAASLQLETDDGSTYGFDLEFEGESILPALSTIGPGGEASGSLVFQIPLDARPTALIDTIGGGQDRIELP